MDADGRRYASYQPRRPDPCLRRPPSAPSILAAASHADCARGKDVSVGSDEQAIFAAWTGAGGATRAMAHAHVLWSDAHVRWGWTRGGDAEGDLFLGPGSVVYQLTNVRGVPAIRIRTNRLLSHSSSSSYASLGASAMGLPRGLPLAVNVACALGVSGGEERRRAIFEAEAAARQAEARETAGM